ncbi:KTSC domain-containing protein [Tundrisphaera lichenicola]|uniref:KTSC domain-containing protein n=1 Tax=Tundrisphaera lichenicola TaxID=2029860 RepID=UPI003EBA3336
MDRQPVESRLIRSVGYEPADSILEVELLPEPARIYRYFDVPYSIFEELMSSDSKGAYFNEQIRDMYAYEEDSPPVS